MFQMASGPPSRINVPLAGGPANSIVTAPGSAVAGWRFNRDGSVEIQEAPAAYTSDHRWWKDVVSDIGDSYWIRLTLISGISPAGPAEATWHALSTARAWSLTRSTPSISSDISQFRIHIATGASDAQIVTSGVYALSVYQTPV